MRHGEKGRGEKENRKEEEREQGQKWRKQGEVKNKSSIKRGGVTGEEERRREEQGKESITKLNRR